MTEKEKDNVKRFDEQVARVHEILEEEGERADARVRRGRALPRRFFGCWSCYHHHTVTQFNRYTKSKIRQCKKHWGDIPAFAYCDDYHFGLMGAGFEGYDRHKYDKRGD